MDQRRTGEKQRAFFLQDTRFHRRRCTGCRTEGHEIAARRQNGQCQFKRILAHRIKHHRHAFAAGDFHHFGMDVVGLAIQHGVIAVFARQFALVGTGCDADQFDAVMLSPLARNQADTARCRIHQSKIAFFERGAAIKQIFNRHALEHHGRALLVTDRGRQWVKALGGHHPMGGVRADIAALIGHAITDFHMRDTRAHGLDNARAFTADAGGQGQRIDARTVIDIEIIHTHRGLADQRLPFGGLAKLDLLQLHDIGSTLGLA